MSKKAATKKTRDLEKSRKEILEVAFWEVFTRGFQGVSVDEIVEKTPYTKGAFYHHFPTKLDLGYALVDEVLKQMVSDRWIKPLDQYENPLDGIVEVLKKTIDAASDESLRLGCPLNNLIQEMSSVDLLFRDKLSSVLEYWIQGIANHLKVAKGRGYLKIEVNVRQLAEFIVMNHEGAFGITKSTGDRRLFLSLHQSLKRYLQFLMN